MQDYPNFGVSIDGYAPEWSDGTEVLTAENGQPWIYRSYDQERVTLTITHPALLLADEQVLRAFYASNKGRQVRFYDPHTHEYYLVVMAGPPRLSGMRSGMHADIRMTLVGVRE